VLLENVPLTQLTRHTSYGQTKMQLQLWNYKTSSKQLLAPTGYLCDGLEHIPPWFRPRLQLVQQAAWFVHQLPLHPKMKFGLIHKISTSAQNHNKKPTHIALFSATSSRYPRNMLRSMPMKFQNIHPMTTLFTLTNTLTMMKTFALDLDTVAYDECSILQSIGFFIYPILPNPPTLPSCKLHH